MGFMLGYVLDGDVKYVASSVQAKIIEHREHVALVLHPRRDIPIGNTTCFYSRIAVGRRTAAKSKSGTPYFVDATFCVQTFAQMWRHPELVVWVGDSCFHEPHRRSSRDRSG